MGYQAMDKVSEQQEKRTAKAIAEGPDMTWTKNPLGWTCCTPSGGSYLVTERGCNCPDHRQRLAGTQTLCKHRVALAMRLAQQEVRIAPPVVADKEAAQTVRYSEEDARFDQIFGRG